MTNEILGKPMPSQQSSFTLTHHITFIKLYILSRKSDFYHLDNIALLANWWYGEEHSYKWLFFMDYRGPIVCSRCLSIGEMTDGGRLIRGCRKCEAAFQQYTITEYEVNTLQGYMKLNPNFVEYLICLAVAEISNRNPNYKEHMKYVREQQQ